MKLKKHIHPNTILFGQNHSLLRSVDPRHQHSSFTTPRELQEEVTSAVPANYRFKEMKLNHYGFYDIDYLEFNK